MDRQDFQKLELNKILQKCSMFAYLDGAKRRILSFTPAKDAEDAKKRLSFCEECYNLLYFLHCERVEPFEDLTKIISRAQKSATLSCAEIRTVLTLLRSARNVSSSVISSSNGQAEICLSLAYRIYFDERLESEIEKKVINDDSLSDSASEKLYDLRLKIRALNERIRARLLEYAQGRDSEYLQDSIVTMRGGRYVIPVKAEHKSHVKGFVHDRSQSGATFFIEPEYVLELNNELIALEIDEKEETERILSLISSKIGEIGDSLIEDIYLLETLDTGFAMAEYSYSIKGIKPLLSDSGKINIIKGRHPLIDKKNVVPVSITFGDECKFLLLSGANTGGKTVTLKMCGLFCLMASCGLFIPAAEGSTVSVYKDVFCDLGDNQSIEDSLSTFSSHMTNIIDILNKAGKGCLVLLDEVGGGTNPDEGQAIAKAVLKYLLEKGCCGILTTHFTPLKEFAYSLQGVENASMEFDSQTLRPLYRIKIGMPGASNALAISRRLGMSKEVLSMAEGYLSEGARSFENIMQRAEDERIKAQHLKEQVLEEKKDLDKKQKEVASLQDKLIKEREKLNREAKAEAKRVVESLSEEAQGLLLEMEEIFKKEELSQADLIKARTLKHKIENSRVEKEEEEEENTYLFATPNTIKIGQSVYIPSAFCEGTVSSVSKERGDAEVMVGSIKFLCKIKDLQILTRQKKSEAKTKVVQQINKEIPKLELNVIGENVEEAIEDVDDFLDKAVLANLEEVKIIHGVGKGILKNAIAQHLKKHKHVSSFRPGKYGEGETGVTFVKLK